MLLVCLLLFVHFTRQSATFTFGSTNIVEFLVTECFKSHLWCILLLKYTKTEVELISAPIIPAFVSKRIFLAFYMQSARTLNLFAVHIKFCGHGAQIFISFAFYQVQMHKTNLFNTDLAQHKLGNVVSCITILLNSHFGCIWLGKMQKQIKNWASRPNKSP